MPLTVGTAGHIDHGKTWLVRALTGKDTDRLPEEQRRGISIDLGYAPLQLADGRRLSVVDVPGHERFVSTMVAGATGIDLYLLVIEHGVIALTKVDAVDAAAVDLAEEEARELVPDAEIVRVSAKTGEGLDALRDALARVASSIDHARADSPTRMYVDRSFSIAGFGTVVTGTLWSGSLGGGDRLRIEPAGRDVRVRSVQVHDEDVESAESGQRVAVSLLGIERGDVSRGDALVEPGAYPVSYRLDVVLEEIAPIEDNARLVVHVGTDHVILRGETTVGGGRVLDPAPPRHRDPARMELLERGEVAATVHSPVRAESLRYVLDGDPRGVERAGPWVFSSEWLHDL